MATVPIITGRPKGRGSLDDAESRLRVDPPDVRQDVHHPRREHRQVDCAAAELHNLLSVELFENGQHRRGGKVLCS